MALDFTALDTQAHVDALIAERDALIVSIAALPAADVSDQGRSISSNAARTAMMNRLKAIREELALMAGPAFVFSRMV